MEWGELRDNCHAHVAEPGFCGVCHVLPAPQHLDNSNLSGHHVCNVCVCVLGMGVKHAIAWTLLMLQFNLVLWVPCCKFWIDNSMLTRDSTGSCWTSCKHFWPCACGAEHCFLLQGLHQLVCLPDRYFDSKREPIYSSYTVKKHKKCTTCTAMITMQE